VTGSAFRTVAPVSAVCAAFRAQPSAYPPEAPKPDVAPTCGGVAGTASAEEDRLRAGFGGGRSRKRQGGKAGEKAWRFSAPERPLLPAVRAVSGGKNGAFLRG